MDSKQMQLSVLGTFDWMNSVATRD